MLFILIAFGTLSGTFAQSDSIPQYKLGTYLRTTGFVFNANWSIVWLKNMQTFLKAKDLARYSGLLSSIPFDAGVRVQDWFFTVNLAVPALWDNDSNSKMTSLSLLVERSFFKPGTIASMLDWELVSTSTI